MATRINTISLLGLLALVSGCATISADSAPPAVPLEIPPAPPHAAPAPSVDDADTNADAGADETTARPTGEGPATPRAVTATPPRDADPPAAADSASDVPSPPLELADADDDSEGIATVRETVMNTTRILDRIDRAALSAALRVEYDTARRFLRQAREALAAGQITYARSLGAKARTIADALGAG